MALRILVAGSAPGNVELVKETFAPLGHEIIPINGVALGLFLARKNFPHLILSELEMIDGSGMEFLAQLKQDPDLASIPFLFLCASECDQTTKKQATALGAQKLLCHPLSQQKLMAELAPYLQERETERPSETPE